MRKDEEEEAVEETVDNVIMFPGADKDIHDMMPSGWHRVHAKIAPHVSHVIIIGACVVVLVGASVWGVHEGIVHHIAIAVIAERMATLGLSRG